MSDSCGSSASHEQGSEPAGRKRGRDPSETTATLDGVFASLDRSNAPGAVVGIARSGRPIYRRAFGLASIEHGLAMSPATRLRIGSTSKHFACLAAFLLAEEGRLEVDAPIGRYVPELPDVSAKPTLRQLMQHTGGLRDYLDLSFTAAGLALQPPGTALAAQLRQGDVNFAPGNGQLYCNGGYHLLSIAIERAAGQPFEDVLRERIFAPLGLIDTDSLPSDMQMVPRIATLHVPQPGGGWRRGIFPTEEVRGEGAMVSTVDDMLAWLAHLRGPWRVGSADTWHEMTRCARLDNGLVSTYACGLWRTRYRGVETLHHSGNVIGGSCQMLTVPSHALDLVIITNGAPVAPTELAKQVLDALLADRLTEAPPRMARSRRYAHLFGTRYHSAEGIVIGFDDVAGKLGASLQLSPPAPILRDEGPLLRVAFEDVGLGPFVFTKKSMAGRPGGGPPPHMDIAESGRVERFYRLPKRAPSTSKAGAGLVGRYRSNDLAADAVVAFDAAGALSMRYRGPYGTRLHTLEAVSAEVFAVTVLDENLPGRYALTVERGEAGAIGAFHISTGRSRRVRFVRIPDDAVPISLLPDGKPVVS